MCLANTFQNCDLGINYKMDDINEYIYIYIYIPTHNPSCHPAPSTHRPKTMSFSFNLLLTPS